jgi:mRNA interferase MazF
MERGDVVLLVAKGDMGKLRPGVIVQADELGDTTKTLSH